MMDRELAITNAVRDLDKLATFLINQSLVATGEEIGHAKVCDEVSDLLKAGGERIAELYEIHRIKTDQLEDDGFEKDKCIDRLTKQNKILDEALELYANPEFYHGIMIVVDKPTGGFDEDFSDDHGYEDYNRPMAGKLARQARQAAKELSDG